MSDIFISYSKADRDHARKLSAYLESLGYSVWFDRSLQSGDEYRDVIVTELAKARAVIVIWSSNSVHSDWVRSEAGRAHADHKLIPVREPTVDYRDIPPPFDVLHTELVSNLENVRAAIVGQLAKPATPASLPMRLAAGLKFHALSWFGIIGAAITLFTGLKGIVELADWAQWLIEHWVNLTHALWQELFTFFGITISKIQAATLSFILFCGAIALGSRQRPIVAHAQNAEQPKRSVPRTLLALVVPPLLFCLVVLLGAAGLGLLLQEFPAQPDWAIWLGFVFVCAIAWLAMFEVVRRLLKVSALDIFGVGCLFMVIFVLLLILPTNSVPITDMEREVGWAEVLAVSTLTPIVMLLIGRSRSLLLRLSLTVTGLIVLLALNKLSRLGIDLRAPKGGS